LATLQQEQAFLKKAAVDSVNEHHVSFGSAIWNLLSAHPLGSLTKRELELSLLQAAVDAGLLEPRADALAVACRIPIARANGYLTDLALRRDPLPDDLAVARLVMLLRRAEIVSEEKFFSIPLQDASLRIWIERKMARLQLNSGDAIRRDHLKLTPTGLARVLDASEGVESPYDALNRLPAELQDATWVKAAKNAWKNGMSWTDAIEVSSDAVALLQGIAQFLL
jgi:hypothetical protein